LGKGGGKIPERRIGEAWRAGGGIKIIVQTKDGGGGGGGGDRSEAKFTSGVKKKGGK